MEKISVRTLLIGCGRDGSALVMKASDIHGETHLFFIPAEVGVFLLDRHRPPQGRNRPVAEQPMLTEADWQSPDGRWLLEIECTQNGDWMHMQVTGEQSAAFTIEFPPVAFALFIASLRDYETEMRNSPRLRR